MCQGSNNDTTNILQCTCIRHTVIHKFHTIYDFFTLKFELIPGAVYMKLCYFSYLLHHSWELLHHLLLKLRVTSKHWI